MDLPFLLYRVYVVHTWTSITTLLWRISFIVPMLLAVCALPSLYVLDFRGYKALRYGFKLLRNSLTQTCTLLCIMLIGQLLAFFVNLLKPPDLFGNYSSFFTHLVEEVILNYMNLIVFLTDVNVVHRQAEQNTDAAPPVR